MLRKKFLGKPESVVNFFFLLAEEVREYLAQLGMRSIDELVGRADVLEVDPTVLHYKNQGLDLSALLVPSQELNAGTPLKQTTRQDHQLDQALDNRIIREARPALAGVGDVTIQLPVRYGILWLRCVVYCYCHRYG